MFRDYLRAQEQMAKLPKMLIYFGRETQRTYGTARFAENEIIINRRCVQTFLHEISHFICWYVYKDKDAHGPTFGSCLDYCIKVWLAGWWRETK
jgi:hypothetical protein